MQDNKQNEIDDFIDIYLSFKKDKNDEMLNYFLLSLLDNNISLTILDIAIILNNNKKDSIIQETVEKLKAEFTQRTK